MKMFRLYSWLLAMAGVAGGVFALTRLLAAVVLLLVTCPSARSSEKVLCVAVVQTVIEHYLPYQTSIVQSAGAEETIPSATRRTGAHNSQDLNRYWRNRRRQSRVETGWHDWIKAGASLMDADVPESHGSAHSSHSDGQTFRGRIACSADGNHNDPDDWAASPVVLAIGGFDAAGVAAQAPTAGSGDTWVPSMKAVHQKFKGERGTYAQFGDSITVSRAFWFGLKHARKNASPEMNKAFERVKDYMHEDCWDWKGPEYGNEGQMTICWAHQNVDKWLKELNPEVAVIMFGTNDLHELELEEYETKTRAVVQKCLDVGTVVILSTIPPRHGHADKAAKFAEAVRKIARELKVPLIDYHAEILKRRPDDWDGALDKFKGYQGFDVPTLIARDGVHPSNPKEFSGVYSPDALNNNGFSLRNYLTLMKYADVIRYVLRP